MVSINGADEAALDRSLKYGSPLDIVIAEELLRDAKEIMDQLGVVFFLRQGTCLGAIRDKAMIPWDDDIDIGSVIGLHGTTETAIDRVASAFRGRGYFVRIEDRSHYAEVAMIRRSTRIDWTCYRIVDDTILHYPGLRIPTRLFTQLEEIDFIGTKFNVPSPTEEYLRRKYGPGWMIPKQAGFEKDILEMVPDGPLPGHEGGLARFFGRLVHFRRRTKLQVLDHESQPVSGADVSVAGVGHSRTNRRGYAKFHLPGDGWYAMTITLGHREEVLYQENIARGETYIYRPDPSVATGRLCVLSPA